MSFPFRATGVFVAGRNVIVEESRRLGSCMSNQGFLFGEFELEFFLQERFDAVFDFLRLRLWSVY